MNALAAVDKLDPKECLLAENVRLDETGNIQSAGALTRQNTSAYAAAAGTGTNNVHSTYWNPSLGAVAGVGQDVFFGLTLGGMARGLAGNNTTNQKMSFASAPNRVYFDVGNVGYWTDLNNLLTVDWPSPVSVGATITGPTNCGTATQTSAGPYFTVPWTSPGNIVSTNSSTPASVTLSNNGQPDSEYLRATMTTNSFAVSTASVTGIAVSFMGKTTSSVNGGNFVVTLIKNGIPVGIPRSFTVLAIGVFVPITFGGSADLWGVVWSQADINSGSLGFQVWCGAGSIFGNPSFTNSAYNAQMTIYQGLGFTAGTGAAGNLSGTYSYKETFVSANGEESEASGPSNSATLGSQQGSLTALQTGDARTTARNIYRKGGPLTSYYLVGTVQDNLSTTYSDNQTDIAALAQGTILAGDIPGDFPNTRLGNTAVRFPALHYDRLFWIVPGTNKIIWSKPLNGFAYPSVNFINVGDGKPISRLISIFGELIIIKTDSIWRLTGTDESSFDLTQTPSAVGTDEPHTVVANPDKIIFKNRWGFWIFNGYTSQPLTSKLDLWMKQEDRTSKSLFGVNGFHPPEVASLTVPTNFQAVANSEKYVCAYAEAGQAANNAILVFDLKHGNITKRTIGGSPLALSIDPVNGLVYVGDATGFISLLDDWNGATQAGAAANLDFQTPYLDLQRGSNKQFPALEFFINTNGQSIIPTIYYDNGANSETLAAISTTSLQRVLRTLQASNSRKAQNISVRLNGSINPINVTGTPQIMVNHIKVYFDVYTGRPRTGQ